MLVHKSLNHSHPKKSQKSMYHTRGGREEDLPLPVQNNGLWQFSLLDIFS